ncbi:putative mfs monosaccharide transporter [Diplodia seriata]|uniref:Putative mfs monosaccharide transporter n=1 Tax=Diplodia seriata TaxID=420778 RepID=A0A0G2FRK6_9PEZI|nr:putative mfs monosaccharide transporter [Diplodia seriata]
MIVCSTVFVGFRLTSRIGIVKKVGWDDYFMAFAWLLAFGLSFSICYGVKYGLGMHEVNIPNSQDPPLRRLEYVFTVLYNPCLMATKTSILVFYLSLSKSHRAFRWGVIADLLVVNVGGAALTVLNIVQCRPISAAFVNPAPPGATCTDIVTLYLSSAPLNIITDLATLFLPMPILTSMRLPKKQKTILVITFGFGVFVAVVDVVRIVYLQSAATTRLRDIQNHVKNDESRNYEQSDFSCPRTPTFFDFVYLKRKKSLVQLTNAESVFPVTMVTILFFLWGFAYGLLDVLNAQFQAIAGMSRGQTVSIHSLYYAGYFVGPLTYGRIVLKKYGFKACFMSGLCIYACGTLVFWPSAVLTSYPAFLISNFIVGLGLSTLEIAANPFTVLCGPAKYAETRINISQGVQAIGTVLSPLLAKKVLFKIDADSLIDVQWTYLGIALFVVLLAVAYYWIPIPEATDIELEDIAERGDDANHARIFNVRVIWITLAMGVLSEFFYCGLQESISTSFVTYMNDVASYIDTTDHLAYSHTAFAVSRFLAALATIWVKPRYVLMVCYAGVLAFCGVCFRGTGNTAAVGIVFVYFFEGPIFSLLFAQSLRGMGRHTKEASALLTASISGGAIFPPINFAVENGAEPGHGARPSDEPDLGRARDTGVEAAHATAGNTQARHAVERVASAEG